MSELVSPPIVVFLSFAGLHGAFLYVLVRIYYHVERARQNAVALILFGTGVFLVTRFLHSADLSMGFAFGLFAVFSLLRYRTETLGTKDMTYLFTVIVGALLAAVQPISWAGLAALDAVILLLLLFLESDWFLPKEAEQLIEYERIENLHPTRRSALLQDLEVRTGLRITSIEVDQISFLKDTAILRVRHVPDRAERAHVPV